MLLAFREQKAFERLNDGLLPAIPARQKRSSSKYRHAIYIGWSIHSPTGRVFKHSPIPFFELFVFGVAHAMNCWRIAMFMIEVTTTSITILLSSPSSRMSCTQSLCETLTKVLFNKRGRFTSICLCACLFIQKPHPLFASACRPSPHPQQSSPGRSLPPPCALPRRWHPRRP